MIISGKDKSFAEVKAVSNCITDLESTPAVLAEFISSLDRATHKEWSIFKKEYGKAIAMTYRGRSIPERKSKGSNRPLAFGKVFGLSEPTRIRIPTIDFTRCKTKVEKVKLILQQEISKELKKEYIEFVLNQH